MVVSETIEMELKILVMVLSLRPVKWLGGEPLQQRKTIHHSRRVVGLLDRVWYILYCRVRIEQHSQTFLLKRVRGCQDYPDTSLVWTLACLVRSKSSLSLLYWSRQMGLRVYYPGHSVSRETWYTTP